MRPGRFSAIALEAPVLALVLCLLCAPALLLLSTSLSSSNAFEITVGGFDYGAYGSLISDGFYREQAARSALIGFQTAFWSTAGGLVLAYWIRFGARRPNLWLFVVAVSLIASYIVRIYAWRSLLGANGALASALSSLGLAADGEPLLLYTSAAVILAQVHVFLPFTALVLVASLAKVEPSLIEQARNLGSSRPAALAHVTLPLVGSALLGALCFTFFLATGDYLTPILLGGPRGSTLGAVIANELQTTGNYVNGAALSFIMLGAFAAFSFIAFLAMRLLGLLPRLR